MSRKRSAGKKKEEDTATREADLAAEAEREAAILKKMMMEEADEFYIDGVRLQGEGKYDEAVACYRKAQEANEEHVGAIFNHGLLLERVNDKKGARELYARCVALTKSSASYKVLHQKLSAFATSV